jgi:hypothetical protein
MACTVDSRLRGNERDHGDGSEGVNGVFRKKKNREEAGILSSPLAANDLRLLVVNLQPELYFAREVRLATGVTKGAGS